MKRNEKGQFIKGFNNSPNENQRIINKCIICNNFCKPQPPSRIKKGKGKTCSKECAYKNLSSIQKKINNSGRFKYEKGWIYSGKYKKIKVPNHPYVDRDGYLLEHRFIMEQYLGRYLHPEEIIHHKDRNTLNNNIDNLQILTRSEHIKLHHKENKKW